MSEQSGLIHVVSRLLDWLMTNVNHNLETILMNQEEWAVALEAQAAKLDATKAQVDKVAAEITQSSATQAAAIEALRQELANVQISEAAVAALDHIATTNEALAAAVQAVDDLNPDVPA